MKVIYSCVFLKNFNVYLLIVYLCLFKESEGEIESPDDMGENDINVLAPGSPVIEKPFLFSCIALGVALIVGLVSHFTLCKRRRKAIMKDSGGKTIILLVVIEFTGNN